MLKNLSELVLKNPQSRSIQPVEGGNMIDERAPVVEGGFNYQRESANVGIESLSHSCNIIVIDPSNPNLNFPSLPPTTR